MQAVWLVVCSVVHPSSLNLAAEEKSAAIRQNCAGNTGIRIVVNLEEICSSFPNLVHLKDLQFDKLFPKSVSGKSFGSKPIIKDGGNNPKGRSDQSVENVIKGNDSEHDYTGDLLRLFIGAAIGTVLALTFPHWANQLVEYLKGQLPGEDVPLPPLRQTECDPGKEGNIGSSRKLGSGASREVGVLHHGGHRV